MSGIVTLPNRAASGAVWRGLTRMAIPEAAPLAASADSPGAIPSRQSCE